MAKLIYSAIASVDGFVADEDGNFAWAEPDEEVHTFVNELERSAGTYLYGRRMYEVLSAWDTPDPGWPAHMQEYARVWRDADKVVYSRALGEASTARTRVEREFDRDAVRALKEEADRDVLIGGPELAGQAIAGGLVDEVHLLLAPVAVGAGKPALPVGSRLRLELLDQRRFASGFVSLRYRVL